MVECKVFCIGYVSFANQVMKRADLLALASQSARDNEKQQITGILLYDDGIFLQFLEGEENAVRELLGKIVKDRRHSRLCVVVECEIGERHFPGWHMALANAEECPDDCRHIVRELAVCPPQLPETEISPTIQHLIGTFLTVTQLG